MSRFINATPHDAIPLPFLFFFFFLILYIGEYNIIAVPQYSIIYLPKNTVKSLPRAAIPRHYEQATENMAAQLSSSDLCVSK